MSLMLFSALVGIALGILVGYFMSIWVIIACSLVVAYMVYDLLRPRRWNSGALGVVLLFGPGIVFFFICMWLAWFFAPGGVAHSIDPSALWQTVKSFLFR